MLNATLCATTRTICCILENYQTEGGVNVPEVLIPFMGGLTFLPYVRESKFDVKADLPGVNKKPKEKQQNEKKAPTKEIKNQNTSVNSTSTAESGDKVADEIVSKIKAKGEAVRDLKVQKGSQEAITKAVEELLAAKQEYKDHTGKDYIAPGTQGSSKDKKKKKNEGNNDQGAKNTQKNEKTKKESNTQLPPPPPKQEATNKVTSSSKNSNAKGVSEKKDKKVNLVELNQKLLNFSYVNGFQPTKEDSVIFNNLVEQGKDEKLYGEMAKFVNVMRWFNHMSSYSPSERASW